MDTLKRKMALAMLSSTLSFQASAAAMGSRLLSPASFLLEFK